MYALFSTSEGQRYGTIASVHDTIEAAEQAAEQEAGEVLAAYPNAITGLMYEVVELPTPAGETGEVGDRIAIDLSR